MTPADAAPEPGAPSFDAARQETVRYHEELYAEADLGSPGTWLEEPHPILDEALALLPDDRPLVAYDLGAGVGRHTLPLLERLPEGSCVVAVDLLGSALDRLRDAAPKRTGRTLRTVAVDLADLTFDAPADLVLAFSAVEHLPSPDAVRDLLARVAAATAPGGVVALGILADRHEITHDGDRRAALVESRLTSDDTARLLHETLGDLRVVVHRAEPAEVTEERDGEEYVLASTLVLHLAVRETDPGV